MCHSPTVWWSCKVLNISLMVDRCHYFFACSAVSWCTNSFVLLRHLIWQQRVNWLAQIRSSVDHNNSSTPAAQQISFDFNHLILSSPSDPTETDFIQHLVTYKTWIFEACWWLCIQSWSLTEPRSCFCSEMIPYTNRPSLTLNIRSLLSNAFLTDELITGCFTKTWLKTKKIPFNEMLFELHSEYWILLLCRCETWQNLFERFSFPN